MSNSSSPRPKPTLDDLLRLKRAERPDAAFWDDFERGLRRKQLAAIVEPRPWWLAPSLWVRKAAPYGGVVAAGAAAIFTVMLVAPSLDWVSASPGERVPLAGAVVPTGSSSVKSKDIALVSAPVVSAGVAGSGQGVSAQFRETKAVSDSAGLANNGGAPKADERTVLASMGASVRERIDTQGSGVRGLENPNSGEARDLRGVADPAEFAVLNLGWESAGAPTETGNFATVALESAADGDDVAAVEPLPAGGLQIQAPAVLLTRHDRLLVKATEDLAGAEERSLAQVREHVVHRLADGEELYASITRVGVSGDRLSLKF